MISEPTPFLTAEWRHVVLVNYEVSPQLLQPLVPRGTELDAHRGRVFLSLVGFRFLNTRMLGWRFPLHEHFDEVNLRFYIRREVAGEVRRAVAFIREIVPRRAIASVARALYNEPYIRLPMRSHIHQSHDSIRARYEWQVENRWHTIEVEANGQAAAPEPESDAEFITEHYWGYTRQRNGSTIEYHVAHPTWLLRTASAVQVTGDLVRLHGDSIGAVLREQPASAFLAEGSAVTVSQPIKIE
jgi:uncharacterized protein YqjF (DUF2071 family)